ncbi:MAG: protein kinase [Victivallaceae bacterium]|nr:protein kinase [Victivallaceae bacterium]
MEFNSDDYELIEQCGRGAYGEVYRARSRADDKLVALKIVRGKGVRRELDAIVAYRGCRHPNLMPVYHVAKFPDGFFYTTEAADNTVSNGYMPDTLAGRMRNGKISAPDILRLADNIAGALTALHNHGIIHRDVKPDNIIFVDGQPILGDPGLVTPEIDASLVGSPEFMPVEVLQGKRPPRKADDFYALSLTLYQAYTGNRPADFPQGLSADDPIARRICELRGLRTPAAGNTVNARGGSGRRRTLVAIFLSILAAIGLGKLVKRHPAAEPPAMENRPVIQTSDEQKDALLLPMPSDYKLKLPKLQIGDPLKISNDDFNRWNSFLLLDDAEHAPFFVKTLSGGREVPEAEIKALLDVLWKTPFFYTAKAVADNSPTTVGGSAEKYNLLVYRMSMNNALQSYFQSNAASTDRSKHAGLFIYNALLIEENIYAEAEAFLRSESMAEQAKILDRITKLGEKQNELLENWRKAKNNLNMVSETR